MPLYDVNPPPIRYLLSSVSTTAIVALLNPVPIINVPSIVPLIFNFAKFLLAVPL